MSLNVLVTGGCGFVGVPVVRRLAREGHRVVAYDDLSRGSADALGSLADDVPVIVGDVRDGETLSHIVGGYHAEVIVHLAALHFIPDCTSDPERCLSTNVLGTQLVLEAAAACPTIRGVVFASSAAVYEPSRLPHHEESRLAPDDVYGCSKLAAEQLMNAFHRRTHIPAGVVRLFNVYGPGETNPHLIPAVIAQARRAATVRLGDLSTSRDYVFTEDVAVGFARLVDAVASERTLTCNLGTGLGHTGVEVVEAIARVMDVELEIEEDTSRLRPSERPVLCADITRAAQLVDWSPTTPFEEGLRAAARGPMRDDSRL
jgi:UDP-glucose 4-epimerase